MLEVACSCQEGCLHRAASGALCPPATQVSIPHRAVANECSSTCLLHAGVFFCADQHHGSILDCLCSQLHTSKGKPIAYQHCSQLVCDARGSTSSKALSKVRNQMEATWKRSLKLKPKNKSDLSTDKWLRYAADLEACNEMVLEGAHLTLAVLAQLILVVVAEANQTVDPHRTASDPTVRAQHEVCVPAHHSSHRFLVVVLQRVAALTKHFVGASQQGSVDHSKVPHHYIRTHANHESSGFLWRQH